MKHPLAIAVQNGFTAALAAEVQNETISYETAGQISRFAMAITREYLKGNSMFMKKLSDFAQDGQMWEDFLIHDKVNLNKFGDD